jgi:hypothetical protein
VTRAARLAFLLLLAWWTWGFLVHPMREDVIDASFMHLIDLPFHEAGHILFSPFGRFVTILGGSLMQVLVPIVCGIAFLTTSWNPFGAAAMLWWAGESLCDVAIYVNDARALQLTLVGGYTGSEVYGHDWEQILTMTGALHLDHRIAAFVQAAGGLLMVAGLGWALAIALREGATSSTPRR